VKPLKWGSKEAVSSQSQRNMPVSSQFKPTPPRWDWSEQSW
jgi:hypothetical protein